MAKVKLSKTTNLVVGLIALSVFIGGIAQEYSYISLDRRTGTVQTAQIAHDLHLRIGDTIDGIDYTVRLDDGRVVSFQNQCAPGRFEHNCTYGEIRDPGTRVTLVEDPPGNFELSNNRTIIEIPVLTTLALIVLIFNVVGFIKKSRRA